MRLFRQMEFVRDGIKDLPGIEKKPAGGLAAFGARVGYALSLGLKEKEIFVFGLLQWAAIGLAYLLWVQMLGWIPEEVWRSAADSNGGSVADLVLLAWSFFCVGLAAFPVGILTGCMGAAHLLHRQGRESTVAACLRLALPQSWALWSFHWIDGWITVNQIVERLPKKNDTTRPQQRALSEALYHAWKLGVVGVLPSIVADNGLVQSGKNSVGFVRDNFLEVATLRAGYSALCWIVGVGAYLGMILLLTVVEVVPPGGDVHAHVYTFYLWAAVPIVVSLAVVMLLLRPVFVLAVCDLYSDHLEAKGERVDLPENPPRSVSAVVAFGCLCLLLAVAYLYRGELGLTDMLSTPYAQDYPSERLSPLAPGRLHGSA